MADVRTVFRGLWVLAAISASSCWSPRAGGADRPGTWRAVRGGALGLTVGVVVVGVVGLVAFDQLFELFHEVFFPAGSYLFDPATDRLVQLFPFQFWDETAMVVGIVDHRGVARRGGRGRDDGRDDAETALPAAGAGDRAGTRNVTRPTARRPAQRRGGTRRGPRGRRAGRHRADRRRRCARSGHRRDRHGRVSLPPWPNSAMDGYAIRAADTARRDRGRAGRARGRSATSRPARRPTSPSSPARPPASRPGARLPTGRRRRRPGRGRPRRSTRSADPGPRGRDATGPAAGRLPGPRARRAGRLRPSGRQRPDGRRHAAPSRARRITRGGRRARRRRGRRPTSSSTAGRAIAVLATGDEVRAPGEPISARPASPTPTGPACARSSPRPAASRSTSASRPTTSTTSWPASRRGLDGGADALIVSGGVSVGPYDVVKTAIETHRPDRPLAGRGPARQAVRLRRRDRPGGGAPVLLFGLPGNPVSSAVTFELFVRPAIRAPRRPPRPAPAGRSRRPRRARHQEPRPPRVPPRRWRNATTTGAPSATRGAASRSTSRAGRGVTSSRPSPPPTPSRSSPRPTTTLPAGAEVALWWLDRA